MNEIFLKWGERILPPVCLWTGIGVEEGGALAGRNGAGLRLVGRWHLRLARGHPRVCHGNRPHLVGAVRLPPRPVDHHSMLRGSAIRNFLSSCVRSMLVGHVQWRSGGSVKPDWVSRRLGKKPGWTWQGNLKTLLTQTGHNLRHPGHARIWNLDFWPRVDHCNRKG